MNKSKNLLFQLMEVANQILEEEKKKRDDAKRNLNILRKLQEIKKIRKK